MLFFTYGPLSSAISIGFARLGLQSRFLNRIALLLVILSVGFVLWEISKHRMIRRMLVTFSFAGMLAPACSIAYQLLRGADAEMNGSGASSELWSIPFAHTPNIYHIVVDGYARADVLRDVVDLDNSDFESSMEQRGFKIARHSRSNYPVTYLSLASTLQGDYPVTEANDAYTSRKKFYALIRGGNSTVAGLRTNGYRYIHAGNSWSGSRCSGREDQCLHASDITRLVNTELEYVLLSMTPLSILTKYHDMDLETLSVLLSKSTMPSPFYLFAHTLPPHPPYLRDAACNKLPRTHAYEERTLDHHARRELYRASVQCVNRQLLALIDGIVANDHQAIVIVHSDHGTEFLNPFENPDLRWSGAQITERFGVLLALRLPQKCAADLGDAVSNVNIMRLVASCLQDRKVPLLPDRYFVAGYEANAEFGKVRELSAGE